ncbi:unnamed protein product, partial [Ectocarpus sp. 12 AP-2014]
GVKETLASATQKLDRALGKLALLTRGGIKDSSDRGPRDERVGPKGMTKDGINDTASTLFAEVKAIFSKAKKQRPAGGSGSMMVTPEDHSLREALVGFNIGLFGDHRTILRRQPDVSVKVDHDYFIRYREQRGDSEGVLRFLKEFTQSQMFHMHMMHVKDRLRNKQNPSTPSPREGAPDHRHHPSPATFLRVSDQLTLRGGWGDANGNGGGGFAPASVKRALSKVLAESLPAGSGSNSYGDPTLNPRALAATANGNASIKDMAKLRAELCRTARESAKLSGIMRVVWVRLLDCRGNKWPHAMEGLRLLKALLLSGPAGCIADALNHVPLIRRLTQYPKGWEDTGVVGGGGGDAGKASPRIRAMAREASLFLAVVTLMMDMNRLALRRDAVANLGQREADRAARLPEKIKLRSRCMPDFSTFHNLVGQASFGDSSNHTGGFDSGGQVGNDDEVAAAVTGALFSSRSKSSVGGSSEYGSQGDGGLQGLPGFGDLGDSSSRAAWQDLAATYSLPAAGGGSGYDEESSDGEVCVSNKISPPGPM